MKTIRWRVQSAIRNPPVGTWHLVTKAIQYLSSMLGVQYATLRGLGWRYYLLQETCVDFQTQARRRTPFDANET